MSESYYGGTVTADGRNLITELMAGGNIEFTRIVVGSGAMPEGVEPIDMKALITPIAEGTSSVPIVNNDVLSMVIEYRNDMNGGLQQGFLLREFGIFARIKGAKEVLLYYATLGDSPQPVNAYKDGRVDIRRYPISIALEVDADIQVGYIPCAFVTSKEVNELVKDRTIYEVERLRNIGKVVGENKVKQIIKEQCISAKSYSLILPTGKWTTGGIAGYPYQCTIEDVNIKATDIPNAVPERENYIVAATANLAGVCETHDGSITFWARNIPRTDIQMQVTLLGQPDIDITEDETTAVLGRSVLGKLTLNTGDRA